LLAKNISLIRILGRAEGGSVVAAQYESGIRAAQAQVSDNERAAELEGAKLSELRIGSAALSKRASVDLWATSVLARSQRVYTLSVPGQGDANEDTKICREE
jgi:hypothetical protein